MNIIIIMNNHNTIGIIVDFKNNVNRSPAGGFYAVRFVLSTEWDKIGYNCARRHLTSGFALYRQK